MLLIVALVVDALIPAGLRPRALRQAISATARATGELERKLNRPGRSAGKRLIRGSLLAVFLGAAAAAAGWAVEGLSVLPFGWVALLVALFLLVTLRSPVDDVRRIARGLAKGDRAPAAAVLGPSAAGLDDPGLVRVCVQYLAERLCEGLVAAVFWYVLLGLPGLAAYRMLNIAARVMPERLGDFGQTPGRLHEALVFLPALLTSVVIALAAAAAPGEGAGAAFAGIAGAKRSRAAVWPVAAFSGALGIRRSGTQVSAAVGRPGPGRRDLVAAGSRSAAVTDLNRAAYLYGVAALLTLGLLAAVAVARLLA